MTAPKFIYFDLGNVLLNFSHDRMCRQLGQVFQADPQAVWDFLFADKGRETEYESGQLDDQAFYEAICERFDRRPSFDDVYHAASDIFWINAGMTPVVAQLADAGHRIGLLSNINAMHWRWIVEHGYSLLPGIFEVLILSYEVGAVKPSPTIFSAAASRAGVSPSEIFYTDDIPGHITGALSSGFDAVPFTTPSSYVSSLRQRGVRINY